MSYKVIKDQTRDYKTSYFQYFMEISMNYEADRKFIALLGKQSFDGAMLCHKAAGIK